MGAAHGRHDARGVPDADAARQRYPGLPSLLRPASSGPVHPRPGRSGRAGRVLGLVRRHQPSPAVQVIAPVLARLRAFLLRDFVNGPWATPHSLRHGPVLDGGVLLCRLPKGILGEETIRLLGSLIVARVWQAATARASIPEDQRKDAGLYLDECVRQEAL